MKVGLYLTFPPSESCPPLLSFQVALETLLLRGPQKPRTHPLANYHYTGNERGCPRGFGLAEAPASQSLSMASSARASRSSLGACTCPPRRARPLWGTQWVLFSSWIQPSPFHWFPRGLFLARRGVPGWGGLRFPS